MHPKTTLDTSSFDARTQQALVLSLIEGLRNGENFVVVVERGREELCKQLDALPVPNLKWEFLEKTPLRWKLRIEKLSERELSAHQQGGCCGMCGGTDSGK